MRIGQNVMDTSRPVLGFGVYNHPLPNGKHLVKFAAGWRQVDGRNLQLGKSKGWPKGKPRTKLTPEQDRLRISHNLTPRQFLDAIK